MSSASSLTRRQLAVLVAGLAACGDDDEQETTAPAPTATSILGKPADEFVLPPEVPQDPNPLGLPPAPGTAAEGARVFAVPRKMLATAKLGAALELRAATMLGNEGEDMIVRVGYGLPYVVHPAYVVVPQSGRFRMGGQLIAAYRGRLHHGIVRGVRREHVSVRYTDLGFKLGDQKLDPARVGVLGDGLVPGAMAVQQTESVARHVLLVSRGSYPGGEEKWLVIGYAGEAQLVPSAALTRLPVPRFDPRAGDDVRVAWRGEMVMATVRSVDRPGLYTVKRPRAGAPMTVGAEMLQPST